MNILLEITAALFVMFFAVAVTIYSLSTNMKKVDVFRLSTALALGMAGVIFIGLAAVFLVDYNEIFRLMASWGY